jgi:hypothetical protein
MSTRETWYESALGVLRALGLPLDMPADAEAEAVRKAYPFGERAYWPYKAWLKAVKDWRADRERLRRFTGASRGAA